MEYKPHPRSNNSNNNNNNNNNTNNNNNNNVYFLMCYITKEARKINCCEREKRASSNTNLAE